MAGDSVFFAKGFPAPAGGACPKGEVVFFSIDVASSLVSSASESSAVSFVGFEAKGLLLVPPDGGDENGFIGDAPEVLSPVPFDAKGLLEDSSFFANGFEADGEDAKGFTGDVFGPLALCEARILAFTFSASSFTCRAFSSVAFNSATMRSSSVASLVSSSAVSSTSSASAVASEFLANGLDGLPIPGGEAIVLAKGLLLLPAPGPLLLNGLVLPVPAELALANGLLLLLPLLVEESFESFFAKGLLPTWLFCKNPSPTFAATPIAAAPASSPSSPPPPPSESNNISEGKSSTLMYLVVNSRLASSRTSLGASSASASAPPAIMSSLRSPTRRSSARRSAASKRPESDSSCGVA